MNNAYKPAMPQGITTDTHDNIYSTHEYDNQMSGFTKREKFAAMAMQGILANPNTDNDYEDTALLALNMAAALLRALESTHNPDK